MRKLPGYRFARRTMVPRIRRSATARSVVHRIFDVGIDQKTPLDVGAGDLLAGVGIEKLPVVVIIGFDLDGEVLVGAVDEIAQLQVLTAGFRPVFVLDSPRFGPPRAFGYPVELLVSESSWIDETQLWHEYARNTLTSILAVYRTTATIVVGSGGLSQTDRLVLTSLRH